MSGIICQCLQEIRTFNMAFIFGKPVEAVTQPNEGCPTELGSYSQVDVMQCDVLDTGMWGCFRKCAHSALPTAGTAMTLDQGRLGKDLMQRNQTKPLEKKKNLPQSLYIQFGLF